MKPYSHRWSLPPLLSKSGLKPTLRARLKFVIIGTAFLLLLANAVVAALFEGQILPGVTVASQNLAWKTQAQARQTLNHQPVNYKLTVIAGDKQFPVTTTDFGAQYDINATVALAYDIGHGPISLTGLVHSVGRGSLGYAYALDHDKLSRFAAELSNQIGRPPLNATIQVVNGVINPIADQPGLSVQTQTLEQLITNSLNTDENVIHISPQPVIADIQLNQLDSVTTTTQNYLTRKINFHYNGTVYTASAADIGHWLTFTPDGQASQNHQLNVGVDPTQIKGWVQSVANNINIQPKNKKVDIRNGVSTITQEGENGLAVDQDKTSSAIAAAMSANQNLDYDLPTVSVAYKTETNSTTTLSDGRYIEINLSSQHLWAYQDQQVIYSSPLTSGATGAGFGTVTGTFHIYYKTTNTYLNGHPYGWNYNVFVQYWMPFYLGYGLHDASWRSSFGGSDYYYGGSHGCVNLPLDTAAFLYSWADVGTTVWVHY